MRYGDDMGLSDDEDDEDRPSKALCGTVGWDHATEVNLLLRLISMIGEVLYIPRRWPHHAVGLERSVSLTENFFAKCNKRVILPKWEAYVQRRMKCEKILGRSLRGELSVVRVI